MSTSASVITIGGLILRTLCNGPSVDSRIPRCPQTIDEVGGLGRGGLERRAIADELDADEEAGSADVADERLMRHQRAQLVMQPIAGVARVSLQLARRRSRRAPRARSHTTPDCRRTC